LVPLLAFPQLTSNTDPPTGEKIVVEKTVAGSKESDPILDLETIDQKSVVEADDYVKLQLRIYRVSILISTLVVGVSFVFFSFYFALSILIGAFSGIFYLRLLARSIGKLGKASKSVSKVQLLVPVVMVLVVSKLPELQLLPAMVGFLLYKPSLIIQFLLEPLAKRSN